MTRDMQLKVELWPIKGIRNHEVLGPQEFEHPVSRVMVSSTYDQRLRQVAVVGNKPEDAVCGTFEWNKLPRHLQDAICEEVRKLKGSAKAPRHISAPVVPMPRNEED